MSQEIINVGSAPNDGMGDPIRNAFIATNGNFAQLFALPNPNPPTTLVGIPGDVAGMYAYDASYFYYCYGAYNGTSTIWARVPQINTSSGNSSISNGTSNVNVLLDSSVTVSVSGDSNIAVFNTTGVSLTGNVAAGNIRTDNYFYANGAPFGVGIVYGNSNVAAYLPSYTGNLDNLGNIYVFGTATAANFIGDGSQLTGVVSSYGDANVAAYLPTFGGLLGNGAVTIDADQITATGIQTSGNVGVGNIEGVNVTSTITLTASGNVYAGNVLTDNYLYANGAPFAGGGGGNGQAIINGNSYANIATAGGNIDIAVNGSSTATFYDTGLTMYGNVDTTNAFNGASLSLSGDIVSANNITATGNISSGNIVTTDLSASGNILTSGIISSVGAIATAAGVTATGNVIAANFATTGPQGNIIGANVISAVTFTATGNVQTTGNVLAQGAVSATGNVYTAGFFVGNFAGNITGNLVNIPGPAGAVVFNDGTGNGAATAGLVFNNSGPNILTILGVLSAQGNVYGGNIIGDAQYLANIQAGNIVGTVNAASTATNAQFANLAITAGNVSNAAQPSITSVGTLTSLTVSGNIVGNTITTSGTGGDIAGANLIATVSVSASGTITAATLRSTASSSPASSSVGTPGQLAWDSNYIYVCIAPNTWARSSLQAGY